MLKPVQKQSVSDAVYDQLADEILSGRMEPGTALPSERVLAEMLGVNRGAIREALNAPGPGPLAELRQGRVIDIDNAHAVVDHGARGQALIAVEHQMADPVHELQVGYGER